MFRNRILYFYQPSHRQLTDLMYALGLFATPRRLLLVSADATHQAQCDQSRQTSKCLLQYQTILIMFATRGHTKCQPGDGQRETNRCLKAPYIYPVHLSFTSSIYISSSPSLPIDCSDSTSSASTAHLQQSPHRRTAGASKSIKHPDILHQARIYSTSITHSVSREPESRHPV